jgi:RNA polymerase sigma-70 factor (ECF subfamily)
MNWKSEGPTKGTVARAKAGEEAALIDLYEWYRPRIFRFMHYRIGHKDKAENLTTEVFLRMLQHLPDFRFQNSSFQAWLFQIARNLVVDNFRRQSIRDHEPIDESLESDEAPLDEIADDRMMCDVLREALMELTESQLDVIALRFIVGLPIADVARTLEKSESAVKSLQARGLKSLRQRLAVKEVIYETSR